MKGVQLKQDNEIPPLYYLAVSILALAPRFWFIFSKPLLDSDGINYVRLGRNIAHNFCYSFSDYTTGDCIAHWGGSQPPGYPFFIALVDWLGGDSIQAVLVAQAIVAVAAICWLVRSLGELTGSSRLPLAVGIVLALSPLTVAWPRQGLTETLAIATTTFAFAEMIHGMAAGRLRILPISVALIMASFVRLDGIMLMAPVALCMIFVHSWREAMWRFSLVALMVLSTHGLWSARHASVGLKSDPVTALFRSDSVPSGYITWAGTWASNEYELVLFRFCEI